MQSTIDRLRLAQFGNLELLAKQVVEGFITGLHKSPFHGFSVEFAEHRLYNSGESTRHIDWKLYGRSDKLFTKKYEEETNLRCQLVIDCSSSMFFPSDNENLTKFEFSVYAAASLIELLKKQRDAVGLSLFTDKLEIHTEAKSSAAHHRFLYHELEKFFVNYSSNIKRKTAPEKCLHELAELCPKRSLIIIFSDLLDDPSHINTFMDSLQHLRHNKHEVILFHTISSRFELNFELDNRPYELVDMETGDSIRLQPNELRENYIQASQNYFNELKLRCANYRIDFIQAPIEQGYASVLQNYLLKRQKLF